jgi:hypothetical protein
MEGKESWKGKGNKKAGSWDKYPGAGSAFLYILVYAQYFTRKASSVNKARPLAQASCQELNTPKTF